MRAGAGLLPGVLRRAAYGCFVATGDVRFPDFATTWRFGQDHADVVEYPYTSATVRSGSVVPADRIVDVFLDLRPPRVSTGDEVLFVSAAQRPELERFAMANELPIVEHGLDPWTLILEPFLDGEESEDHKEESLDRLERVGVDRDESFALRERFAGAVMLYNFAVPRWEWVSLGHRDLLQAVHPDWRYSDEPFVEQLRQQYGVREPLSTPDEYREIYWLSMDVALRGFARHT